MCLDNPCEPIIPIRSYVLRALLEHAGGLRAGRTHDKRQEPVDVQAGGQRARDKVHCVSNRRSWLVQVHHADSKYLQPFFFFLMIPAPPVFPPLPPPPPVQL